MNNPYADEQYTNLIAGLTYVDIHTPDSPGGEIRGQILPVWLAYPFTASLSEVRGQTNNTGTNATGLAIFSLAENRSSFDIGFTGLTGTATEMVKFKETFLPNRWQKPSIR